MKKSADDKPMSEDEYRSVLTRLGLTQGEAAERLGITIKTSGNYANGRNTVPLATAKLLRLWAQLQTSK